MKKHHQAIVRLILKALQRQIIITGVERILKFHRNKLETEKAPNGYEFEDGCKDLAQDYWSRHYGNQCNMDEQRDRDELRIWEWKLCILNLLGIQKVDKATQNCLVNA